MTSQSTNSRCGTIGRFIIIIIIIIIVVVVIIIIIIIIIIRFKVLYKPSPITAHTSLFVRQKEFGVRRVDMQGRAPDNEYKDGTIKITETAIGLA